MRTKEIGSTDRQTNREGEREGDNTDVQLKDLCESLSQIEVETSFLVCNGRGKLARESACERMKECTCERGKGEGRESDMSIFLL